MNSFGKPDVKNNSSELDEERKRHLDAYRLTRRRPTVLFIVLGLMVLTGGSSLFLWLKFTHQTAGEPLSVTSALGNAGAVPTLTATPASAPDPLTGELVTPEAATQPIVGVMIENLDPDARPQSGLGQADVVYEALAEGGITRFLALFQEPLPKTIGPIRSLRPYFLTWGLEYNSPVVHAGGSQPALADIQPSGLKNIDALALGAPTFYRTSDRAAPHNLYTSASLLESLLKKLRFATVPTFTPLPRKVDAPETNPSHPIIAINFSTNAYKVVYHFDAASDSYARDLAGQPHIDRTSGKQIMVKNIVIEFVPTSYSTQPDGKPQTIMNLTGQGKALIFRDGSLVEGSWRKTSQKSQTQLVDGNGQPIAFNSGSTWYEIVPTGTVISD